MFCGGATVGRGVFTVFQSPKDFFILVIISAEEKSGFVEICIVDNGIGIEPDLLKKIFKIETRHSTTGTANESGTGLGLLLCKELAEKNGGNISIESTVGVGTTIYLSLPKGKEAL